MKKLLFIACFLFATFSSLQAQNWQTDFETAKVQAQTDSIPILLVFQGSDWCAPCIKLDRNIWSTDTFKEYADSNFVLLQADFPRRKKNALSDSLTTQNAFLAETYNQQGFFPHVVLLDGEGSVLGQTGYKKFSPEKYIAHLKELLLSNKAKTPNNENE